MFIRSLLFALVVTAISASANCIHGTSLHRRQVTEEGKVEVSKFGYSGTQGPVNWAQLDPANAQCATSKVQSPIVLDNTISKAASAPKVVIENVEEAEFENLGTTLETIVTGTTTFEGKDFTLQQFHLHTPSEHRINEEYFPLEMHMVHEAEDGSIAVIAVPFQLTEDGSTTELLTSVIENIDDVKEPGSVTKTGALNFEELVDAIQTKPLFQYTGSLTTPPCAEGLTFLVVEEPLPLNVKTYNSLKATIKFNSRYAQNNLGEDNLLEIAAVDAVQAKCAINGTLVENTSSAVHETKTAATSSAVEHKATTTSSTEHKATVTSSAAEQKVTTKAEEKTVEETKTTAAAAHETKLAMDHATPVNNDSHKSAEGSADVVCQEQCKNKMWRRRAPLSA
ncbi:carbonic anhydrase [Moniliophthora roreri MCA 2997]|uniref:Carbonic anhydrase n=2 Tax=Moniliophthora roreri TaxID=221103 RepID=V2XCB3_MONRO|nr:carbonic anhydrase [Moniliophthora roreri MCA 2997]KAI3613619.1 carbonic anhydrase [Moniliophthora roreri]